MFLTGGNHVNLPVCYTQNYISTSWKSGSWSELLRRNKQGWCFQAYLECCGGKPWGPSAAAGPRLFQTACRVCWWHSEENRASWFLLLWPQRLSICCCCSCWHIDVLEGEAAFWLQPIGPPGSLFHKVKTTSRRIKQRLNGVSLSLSLCSHNVISRQCFSFLSRLTEQSTSFFFLHILYFMDFKPAACYSTFIPTWLSILPSGKFDISSYMNYPEDYDYLTTDSSRPLKVHCCIWHQDVGRRPIKC